jgi:hypothetical protein
VDAFWQHFEPLWEHELLACGQRRRPTRLHPAEILTLLILFQQSGYRTFKGFYQEHVQVHLRQEFPQLVSYTRFIDSTSLAVCHAARIQQHRVFRVDARRGKTSVGWFYGFKLHLVVNDRGELLAFCLPPGNTDDRRPVPRLARRLFGRLFGDKGHISAPLAEHLFLEQGLRLITKLRKNMRNILLPHADKLLLRQRALIETIIDQLKNVCQIEHSRHRDLLPEMRSRGNSSYQLLVLTLILTPTPADIDEQRRTERHFQVRIYGTTGLTRMLTNSRQQCCSPLVQGPTLLALFSRRTERRPALYLEQLSGDLAPRPLL